MFSDCLYLPKNLIKWIDILSVHFYTLSVRSTLACDLMDLSCYLSFCVVNQTDHPDWIIRGGEDIHQGGGRGHGLF